MISGLAMFVHWLGRGSKRQLPLNYWLAEVSANLLVGKFGAETPYFGEI